MGNSFFLRLLPGVILIGLAAGCGSDGTTVSGTVTFNDQPIESGNINFIPADGTGKPAGGEIRGGSYTVRNVTPGKYKVVVAAYAPGDPNQSMDDALKAAKAKGGKTGDVVNANSDGNSQVHDIAEGRSELNLKLRTLVTTGGPAK